jgi:hypothetical protein
MVWRPTVWARGAIQHFAAGIVIAAVASEVDVAPAPHARLLLALKPAAS